MDDPAEGCVLVTGASGFIGRHVVVMLSSEGWNVRAAARDLTAVPRGSGIVHAPLHDLAGSGEWGALLDGVTHVVHLAGLAHRRHHLPPALAFRVNAEAAGELAEAAARANVQRFLFVSTVRAQCGPSYPGVLREEVPPDPTDDYGRSKLAGEREVREQLAEAVILRPVLVYGRGVSGNMAALRRVAELPVPLPGKGLKARRSVLSVGNLAGAISFCLRSANTAGQTFLVADPEPRSIEELLSIMRAALGRSPGLFRAPAWLLHAALRLTGRADYADRLLHSLEVDTQRLIGAGWLPSERTEDALCNMMIREEGVALDRGRP